MSGFLQAYITSMRPYTLFVTGTAGLIGILSVGGKNDFIVTTIVLSLLFIAYGLNQVINDILGTREDRVNAPLRPSVTGELDRNKALVLTLVIFLIGAIVSYLLNPLALLIMILGFSMNIAYEYLKGIPLLGNLWFGGMISASTAYGAVATSDMGFSDLIGETDLLLMILLVALIQSNLCYFTYFKDERGDREAEKMTLIVLLRRRGALLIGALLMIIPFILLPVLHMNDLWDLKVNTPHNVLAGLSLFLFLTMVVGLFAGRMGKRKPLELDFQASVLFHCALISLISPMIGAVLGLLSFVSILILFHLMYRKRFYG